MIKAIAIIGLAVTLTACGTPRGYYIDVATGVDAQGNVIIERQFVPTGALRMDTPMESLSDGPCWNPQCN